jgi:hypothetical protein
MGPLLRSSGPLLRQTIFFLDQMHLPPNNRLFDPR